MALVGFYRGVLVRKERVFALCETETHKLTRIDTFSHTEYTPIEILRWRSR